MSTANSIPLALIASFLLCHPSMGSGDDRLVWGENVGIVIAVVDKIHNEKGLTVHAAPSAESAVLGYLPLGTKIQGTNEFKNGWVKLQGPAVAGWVNLKFLKPTPFDGMVTTVDQQDLCLGIRAGPSTSREKVGCAQIGEILKLTGIMTTDNWLQLADRRGWVNASSVQISLDDQQTVGINVGASTAVLVEPVEGPSRDKRVTAPPGTGNTEEKGSGSEKAPAESSLTSTPPQIAAPAPKGALDKTELTPVVCSDGWCVDYGKSQVTHDGHAVSGIECLRDSICANIVAQHHAAKAAIDGIMTFGNFKLLANGVILDSGSGKVLVSCNDKGGVDHNCVANFLRETFAGSTGDNKKGSVSEKAGKPAAKFNKPATASSTSRKPKTERSERPFSSPFFDQNKSEQQMIENAWEDSGKRMPGGL